MSRQTRALKAQAAHQEKVARLRTFNTFVLAHVGQANAFLSTGQGKPSHHIDVKMTSRQVKDAFGNQCRDIFERIFTRRWSKFKFQSGEVRDASWMATIDVLPRYCVWANENKDATPADALRFLDSIGAQPRRMVRVLEGEVFRWVEMTKAEHDAYLDEAGREIRKAWAARVFSECKAKSESMR